MINPPDLKWFDWLASLQALQGEHRDLLKQLVEQKALLVDLSSESSKGKEELSEMRARTASCLSDLKGCDQLRRWRSVRRFRPRRRRSTSRRTRWSSRRPWSFNSSASRARCWRDTRRRGPAWRSRRGVWRSCSTAGRCDHQDV